MKRTKENPRRPALQISLGRASRLHQLVGLLAEGRTDRETILSSLGIGLRTFYRELELLKKCGIRSKHVSKSYELQSTLEEAQGRLPFPDPQLSFAEMAELAGYPGEASKRLAVMYNAVIQKVGGKKPKGASRKGAKSQANSTGKKGK